MRIRRQIQLGFVLFSAVQFFLLVALAIFSYHYSEDRTLARLIEQESAISHYQSFAALPEQLKLLLGDTGPGTVELSGNDNTSLTGTELHVHIFNAAGGMSYRVLRSSENPQTLLLLRDYALFALIALILLTAFGGWTSITVAHRVSQPVERLVARLDSYNPDTQPPSFSDQLQGTEVRQLAQTLEQALDRLHQTMNAEKTFARNVGHELRTPLTVIRSAVDHAIEISHYHTTPVLERARRACEEMELMTAACLDLRNSTTPHQPQGDADISEMLKQMLREYVHLLDGKDVTVNLQLPAARKKQKTSRSLARLIIGNVLRNAFIHCDDGNIEINLTEHLLTVSNKVTSGKQRDSATNHTTRQSLTSQDVERHGVGLSILQQACRQTGWQFNLQKKDELHIAATVIFASS